MFRQTVRLAMRVEGDFWTAYLAKADAMDGAIVLGSIRMALVTGDENRERKDAFMQMMREGMSDVIEAFGGEAVGDWNEPRPAPEHEKAGRA